MKAVGLSTHRVRTQLSFHAAVDGGDSSLLDDRPSDYFKSSHVRCRHVATR